MSELSASSPELILKVMQALASGDARAPATLAVDLDVDEQAVRAALPRLADHGVKQRRDGSLRMPAGFELLDTASIRAVADDLGQSADVDVRGVVGSTNDVAKDAIAAGRALPCLVVAEAQTAGRGRRGRQWSSPVAAYLYWSLALELPGGVQQAQGVSLLVGLAVAEAIEQVVPTRIQLKWPNDLMVDGRKLGGILVELVQEGERSLLIIGVGVNVAMPGYEGAVIDQSWTDLRTLGGTEVSRNRLAGIMLAVMLRRMQGFLESGLNAALRREWLQRDPFQGCRVVARSDQQEWRGTAAGLDVDGALLLETEAGPVSISAGQVSLRLEHPEA